LEQRIYQGSIDPDVVAQHLLDSWDQEDTVAQALEPVSEGLRVTLGAQQWYRDGGGQIMVGGLIGFSPSSLPGRWQVDVMSRSIHS
jgi:hypothetical protein